MNAYLDGMQRYFDFSGRSTRAQYWLFTLIMIVMALVGGAIDGASGSGRSNDLGIVSTLITLVHFIPSLAVTVRRLHDIDRSGWWILIVLVPLAGFIVMLVFTCTASSPGSNRFGPTIKQNGVSPTPSYPGASSGVAIDQIEKLAALRESGAIDDEEFKQMKAKALASGTN